MSNPRIRQASPPRIYVDPTRASTGTILSSSYDTRFAQNPRASFSSGSSARDSISSSRNSVQPVARRTYVDQAHPGATISSTTYAVRPRRDSDTSATRRPLSVMTKNASPPRGSMDYTDSPRDIGSYKAPSRDDPTRFLVPARQHKSGHHVRHNSATRAEMDHLPASRPSRNSTEYHRRGPYVEKVYSAPRPQPIRYSEEDGYSYTTPKEQFARDFAPRPRRESLNRRERPSSAVDAEFKGLPFRRDTAPPRSSTRQLDRIEPADPRLMRSGFDSDVDRPRESNRPRAGSRAVVHQRGEDGYSSLAEDYDPRRLSVARDVRPENSAALVLRDKYRESDRELERKPEKSYRREYDRERLPPSSRAYDRESDRYSDRPREKHGDHRERDRDRDRPGHGRDHERGERDSDSRRKHHSRDTSPDDAGLKGLATVAGLGGLAAGLRKTFKNSEESEDEKHRQRKHRRRRSSAHRDDGAAPIKDPENIERSDGDRRSRRPQQDSSGSDTPDDAHQRARPSSRTRERRPRPEAEAAANREMAQDIGNTDPAQQHTVPGAFMDGESTQQDASRGPDRGQGDSPTTNEGRTLSPGEGEDDRPRRVQLVEPFRKEDAKPKGILKPPREVPFPEDPNPQREGVAPLKAAGQGGIPPGSRWTKISRMLVNPEALERANERFEERDDYVIVLRVLRRDEIEKFAAKTREIRETREKEWQEQLQDRRRRKEERSRRDDLGTDEDEYDDDRPGQLAIEAPPAQPPVDLRNLQPHNNMEHMFEPAAIPVPTPSLHMDTSSYSQNV